MAEQIISPGVLTRENDLSFLPQGVGQIGAAIVGPTEKGPAFVPTVINSYSQFVNRFGSDGSDTYVPNTVREYLQHAGSVTVCRVLAGGGYKAEAGVNEYVAIAAFPSGSAQGVITSVIFPSKNKTANGFNLKHTILSNETPSTDFPGVQLLAGAIHLETGSSYVASGSVAGTLNLRLSGSAGTFSEISGSTNPTSTDYIWNQVGDNADNSLSGEDTYGNFPGFTYINFKGLQSDIFNNTATGYAAGLGSTNGTNTTSGSATFQIVTQSATDLAFNGDGLGKAEGYSYASTPFIQSQIALGRKDLFKVHTLNHGKYTSRDYKISIANLVEPTDIDNEQQYSRFSVIVRKFNDTDSSPIVIETFNDCTLDPNDNNYIAKKIGDRYPEYNETLEKVEMLGDFPNLSQHIRVEVAEAVKAGALSPKLSPKGFKAVKNPINLASLAGTMHYPSASYEGVMTLDPDSTTPQAHSNNGYLGFKFIEKEQDNDTFVRSLPDSAVGNITGDFSVENYSGHPSQSYWKGSLSASLSTTGTNGPLANQLKFTVPFQGGDDGIAPWTVKQIGKHITSDNVYGFDISDTSKAGYSGYKKALDILSNQDEYDINMLAVPGIIHAHHSPVTNYAVDMVEGRGDAFYVMDLSDLEDTVVEAIDRVGSLDTNYAAAYYPWVKVQNTHDNRPFFVPPSVIVPGAIAQSDNIGAEWFAPAGLNRGVLGSVLEAKNNLTQSERDQLYQKKINPIASFPATGICIWGQKTLQERATALDRINVRRLLITMKKFIASSSKFLVFEQNTLQTRTRFLNIVTPYLESIQSQQGLFAFRVIMDDTNNTSITIDRNELVGAIYIQPTKTAEFIILDFNVLPTGATFPS